MRVVYDAETDTLTITLRDEPVRESEEKGSGVILDYAADRSLVGMEILDARRRYQGPDHRNRRCNAASTVNHALIRIEILKVYSLSASPP